METKSSIIIPIPERLVGLLIGKSGTRIRSIEQETGAKCIVKQSGPSSNVVIKGFTSQVKHAQKVIDDIICTALKAHIQPEQYNSIANSDSFPVSCDKVQMKKFKGRLNPSILKIDPHYIYTPTDEVKDLADIFENELTLKNNIADNNFDKQLNEKVELFLSNANSNSKDLLEIKISLGKILFYKQRLTFLANSKVLLSELLSYEYTKGFKKVKNLFHNWFREFEEIQPKLQPLISGLEPKITHQIVVQLVDCNKNDSAYYLKLIKKDGEYGGDYLCGIKKRLFFAHIVNNQTKHDLRIYLRNLPAIAGDKEAIIKRLAIDEDQKTVASQSEDFKIIQSRFSVVREYVIPGETIYISVEEIEEKEEGKKHMEINIFDSDLKDKFKYLAYGESIVRKKLHAMIAFAMKMNRVFCFDDSNF